MLPAGDEVVLAKMSPYGWSESMAVGTRFTDGLNFLPIAATAQDFPPTDYDAAGGVDPGGLIVPAPPTGDQVNVELQVGFEVVAAGKSRQQGVRVRYEYQGRTREVVVPSHLSICAPATVKCAGEDC